ncbi:Polypeptide N-acetylgalactosaminyltransferase 10 [Pteropus alecto]|uniref:Polypeptide N-acetylgalactosaminyltransferase 10 n=1 Tax=Pteropus alecto TaxID=9402 RepID=L5L2M3_PTEAL|nr:Polypeptide N-acetylgalactosaminyltransferase 10 [Pteropus alecto]
MRRKEKRLLQAVALVLAALVLLPNVGLWALYRERQPDGTPGGSGAAVPPAAGQMHCTGLGPQVPCLNVSWPRGKRLTSLSDGVPSLIPVYWNVHGTYQAAALWEIWHLEHTDLFSIGLTSSELNLSLL